MLKNLPPWEKLLKRMVWAQLGDVKGKRILDFGSGIGISANHYAQHNEVVAIEPDSELVTQRWKENSYQQIVGSVEALKSFPDACFDMILCHSVLEYVPNREEAVTEFCRLLKPKGELSVVKHNPPGRVMQMTVLLNQFERAERILSGKDDLSTEYGTIHYYGDSDIEEWCDGLEVCDSHGICTFWRLQQNQEIQHDEAWQEKMLNMEMQVSDIEIYKNIAFFHHVLFRKK